MRTVRRRSRAELVKILDALVDPKTPDSATSTLLIEFCAHFPDPAFAMDMIVEPGIADDLSDEEMVDLAMARPARPVASLSVKELRWDHPLRDIVVEPAR